MSFCFLFRGDMSLRTKWDWHKVHQLVCKLNSPCKWVRSTNLVPLEEQTISSLTRFGILWTQILSLTNLWLDGSWKSSTKVVRATSKKFLQETHNPKDYALVQLYFNLQTLMKGAYINNNHTTTYSSILCPLKNQSQVALCKPQDCLGSQQGAVCHWNCPLEICCLVPVWT